MIGIVADIHIYHSLIITNHEDILHLFLVQSRQCTDGQNRFVPIQQRAAAAQPWCGWHSQGGGASLFTGEKIKHHLVHLHFYVTITGAWSSKPRYKDTSSLAHGRTPPTSSKQSQKKNEPNFQGWTEEIISFPFFLSIYPFEMLNAVLVLT